MLHRPYEQMYAACEPPFQKAESAFSLRNLRSHFRAPVFLHPQACNCYYTVYGPVCQYIFRKIFAKNGKNRRISRFGCENRRFFLKILLISSKFCRGLGQAAQRGYAKTAAACDAEKPASLCCAISRAGVRQRTAVPFRKGTPAKRSVPVRGLLLRMAQPGAGAACTATAAAAACAAPFAFAHAACYDGRKYHSNQCRDQDGGNVHKSISFDVISSEKRILCLKPVSASSFCQNRLWMQRDPAARRLVSSNLRLSLA